MADTSTLEIYLERVRSFAKPRWIPLARLTLLVGENSSGKSTFLAIANAVLDKNRFPSAPAFNAPPYSLGNFDTIASSEGKGHGRAKSFAIGFRTDAPPFTGARELTARYANQNGESELSSVSARTDSGSVSADVDKGVAHIQIPTVRKDKSDGEIEHHEANFDPALARRHFSTLFLGRPFLRTMHQAGSQEAWQEDFDRANAIDDVVLHAHSPFPQPLSLAPIRSKPRRTYDELSEVPSPEGDHIPTVISRLLARSRESDYVRRVKRSLVKFGTSSGLFKKLSIRRLGKSAGDPFRIEVSAAGQTANLIDVGYGVSQSLPIVVESTLSHPNAIMFLQQPEVHLHPKAQAALGTFFVDLVAGTSRTFAVETHSDYLVDRVRQEVAKGRISPDEVLILFFAKPKLETTVYPIRLDEHGNVLDAPSAYRQFFLQEELNLLSRANP